jgi:shikimate kinase
VSGSTDAGAGQRPVAVLGLMGAGKTTVASALAEALGRPLRDSDPDLRAARGIDAAVLAEQEGPDALHRWEAEHALAALAERPPVVLAAAASCIEVPECRAALDKALVLWLDAPPAVLAERFVSGSHRPRFGQEVAALVAEQDGRRRPLLEQVADVRLDASAAADEVRAAALAAVGADR